MKEILRHIFQILTKKEKQRFIRLAVLDVMISILDIGFLILLLLVINFYTQHDSPGKYASLFSGFFHKFSLLPVLLFFLLFSIKNFFAFLVFRKQYDFIYDTASRISKDQLLKYLDGDYMDYIRVDSAVYQRSIGQQPLEFCNYILKGIQQIISQSILIVLTVIPIIVYNAALFPLLLLALLPPVVLSGFLMKKKLNTVRLSIKKTSENAGQHLKEALAGFVESNMDNKNHFFSERYHLLQSALNKYQAEHQVIQNLPSRLIEVFAVFGLFILVAINTSGANAQELNIITIGAFIAAAYKIIPGIVRILNSIGQVKTYSFTIKGLAETKSDHPDIPGAKQTLTSVEFVQVYFSYDTEPVLHNFSMKINAGDFAGIAGVSGMGKSTVINLLLGFLTPDKGEILVNGRSTTAVERRQYWPGISYVKQQSFLIHDSFLKNITLSENNPNAEKLNAVMQITGVDRLINKAPDGINTTIKEEGKNLSGGQRQRLVLARALYKDFSTLILDEPFNELDDAAEQEMLKYLHELAAGGKTVILITHSKESFAGCSKKITME